MTKATLTSPPPRPRGAAYQIQGTPVKTQDMDARYDAAMERARPVGQLRALMGGTLMAWQTHPSPDVSASGFGAWAAAARSVANGLDDEASAGMLRRAAQILESLESSKAFTPAGIVLGLGRAVALVNAAYVEVSPKGTWIDPDYRLRNAGAGFDY